MKLIYFAGSVGKNDWRNNLVGDNQRRIMSNGIKPYKTRDGGEFIYCGPESISCDHGCYHGNGSHGMSSNCCSGLVDNVYYEGGLTKQEITARCLLQIRQADALFIYISKLDSYATYLEVGYALALKKQCYLFIDPSLDIERKDAYGQSFDNHCIPYIFNDLWFIQQLCIEIDSLSIPKELLTYTSPKQQYHDYLQSEQWKTIAKKKRGEADNRCQLCNNNTLTLHVHHRTYVNIYHENINDLIVLCENCHKKFHNKGGNNG